LALQIRFFMAPDDERALLRLLTPLQLELWPELSSPRYHAELVSDATVLTDPAYYLAAGEVTGYPIKRGPARGQWKLDEVSSPVIHFSRSLPDEDGELRSGSFWAETESSGDQARTGGKPVRFMKAVRELQELIKSRYRKSTPVKGSVYFVGPVCARLGLPLREEGRKGLPVSVYR
jgi:nucleoid-associated protein YgaU